MKKLFFSAVALIAFSSVSMANTIEIEDLVEVEPKAKSCMQVYMETYEEFVELGFEEDAVNEATSAYGECISGKGYSIN